MLGAVTGATMKWHHKVQSSGNQLAEEEEEDQLSIHRPTDGRYGNGAWGDDRGNAGRGVRSQRVGASRARPQWPT